MSKYEKERLKLLDIVSSLNRDYKNLIDEKYTLQKRGIDIERLLEGYEYIAKQMGFKYVQEPKEYDEFKKGLLKRLKKYIAKIVANLI